MELNRKEVVWNLERLVDKYAENGSYNTYCTLLDSCALIRELTEELEKERTWADSMIDNLRDDVRELTEENERLKKSKKEWAREIFDEVEKCVLGTIEPSFTQLRDKYEA